MKKTRCAVIGVGYLGQFHAEKYASLPNADLVAVCDHTKERSSLIAQKYQTQPVLDYRELANKVDAVSIAVPTALHYEVAKFFLEQNVHVLLEKPITPTMAEASELVSLAKKNNCLLQIGHLERFNPAFVAAQPHLSKTPDRIEAKRFAPFKQRGSDVSVILDLMIHDIDLILNVVRSPVRAIHAEGKSTLTPYIDVAEAQIEFENGCSAHLSASRVSQTQMRELHLYQTDFRIHIDLQNKSLALQPDGRIETYAHESSDALRDEIAAFLNSIQQNKPAVVPGEEALCALGLALQITDIIQTHERS